ncbi:polyprenyl synthetase family protein [Pseudactinotalea sp. HY160]|uniref:polyprenyl synthetase family protein n=1 Tax=Pseudactinotalea sp. HY160 TaxID=2654490 RepID=UPI001D134488|nr:polyprenyl synthetase family protein [Pseudactinotalea sp. HY160]
MNNDAYPQGPAPEVGAVLEGLMAENRRRAAGHGAACDLLWRELRRAVAGGKHFRGRLVIEVHRGLGGGDHPAAARLGAAFELLHAGFLVHDDLIDHDTVRRGVPNLAAGMHAAAVAAGAGSAPAQHFAEASAVLAGDLAIGLAHRLVAEVDGPARIRGELAELLWDTIFVSVAGELDDVAAGHGLWEVSHEKAMSIAAEKTAFYSFQAPVRAAAILADAPAGARELLDEIGHGLGVAFQLADDLVGLFAPEEVTGKSSLSDLREGKATSLMLHARTLPVWSSLRDHLGRADLDMATAEAMRTELARSGAPVEVDRQAREVLVRLRETLAGAALGPAVTRVLLGAAGMIEASLDGAAEYVARTAHAAGTAPAAGTAQGAQDAEVTQGAQDAEDAQDTRGAEGAQDARGAQDTEVTHGAQDTEDAQDTRGA